MGKFRKGEAYSMFRKSKPWGYHPQDVEDAISNYEKVTQELNDRMISLRQENAGLKEVVKRLERELQEMHIQMSALELPEAEEAITETVLSAFKDYNVRDHGEIQPPPKQPHQPKPKETPKQKVEKEPKKSEDNNNNGKKNKLFLKKNISTQEPETNFLGPCDIDADNSDDGSDSKFGFEILT